jgi:hypothetical protein
VPGVGLGSARQSHRRHWDVLRRSVHRWSDRGEPGHRHHRLQFADQAPGSSPDCGGHADRAAHDHHPKQPLRQICRRVAAEDGAPPTCWSVICRWKAQDTTTSARSTPTSFSRTRARRCSRARAISCCTRTCSSTAIRPRSSRSRSSRTTISQAGAGSFQYGGPSVEGHSGSAQGIALGGRPTGHRHAIFAETPLQGGTQTQDLTDDCAAAAEYLRRPVPDLTALDLSPWKKTDFLKRRSICRCSAGFLILIAISPE